MQGYTYSIIICLLLHIAATAQESTADSLRWEINLDDVVLTAQYTPTDSKSAVHDVTVIKALDIERQGLNNLAEVLANELNLNVSTDPILGNGLQIQGLGGENVQIMIDGVPVIGRVGGNIDLSQINLTDVAQIEIIKGALSAQFGSNASGGVVNIITKKSQLEKIKIQAESQWESIGIRNSSLGISAQIKDWYVSVSGFSNRYDFGEVDSLRIFDEVILEDGSSYRTKRTPWNPKTQAGLDAKLRYNFSDKTSAIYSVGGFNETLNIYGEVKRPIFKPYAFDQTFNTKRRDHRLVVESKNGDYLYFKSTSGLNNFERLRVSERLDFEADTLGLVAGDQDTTQFTSILHRSSLSTRFDSKINGQLGVEYLNEAGTGKRILDTLFEIGEGSRLINYAAWMSLQYSFSNQISLQGNLRYAYNTKFDHPLVPAFNFKYTPSKYWMLKASYARGFRAPSIKELAFNFIDINHFIVGNPMLRPERSQNVQASAQYYRRFESTESLKLYGQLFYNFIQNRIILAEFETLKFNYQNVEIFETRGLSAIANYGFKKKLDFELSYTYTQQYNILFETESATKYLNVHQFANSLSFEIPKTNMRAVITHNYFGKQTRFYIDDQDELQQGYIGRYQLLNATLSRNFWNKRLFIAMGAKNILDTQTAALVNSQASAHSSAGNSQLLNWGRTYFVRLKLNFGVK